MIRTQIVHAARVLASKVTMEGRAMTDDEIRATLKAWAYHRDWPIVRPESLQAALEAYDERRVEVLASDTVACDCCDAPIPARVEDVSPEFGESYELLPKGARYCAGCGLDLCAKCAADHPEAAACATKTKAWREKHGIAADGRSRVSNHACAECCPTLVGAA